MGSSPWDGSFWRISKLRGVLLSIRFIGSLAIIGGRFITEDIYFGIHSWGDFMSVRVLVPLDDTVGKVVHFC